LPRSARSLAARTQGRASPLWSGSSSTPLPVRSRDLVDSHRPGAGAVDGFSLETHSQLLHDPSGCAVSGLMDAHDAIETHLAEPERQGCPCSFGCEALAPMGGSEPPSYLNRRQNLRNEVRNRQSYEANPSAGGSELHRKQAEALILPGSLEDGQRSPTLL